MLRSITHQLPDISRNSLRRIALGAVLATAMTLAATRPAHAALNQPCLAAGAGTYHFLIGLPNRDQRDAMLVLEEERGCLVGTLIIDGERAVRLNISSIEGGVLKATLSTEKGTGQLTAALTGTTPHGELVVGKP